MARPIGPRDWKLKADAESGHGSVAPGELPSDSFENSIRALAEETGLSDLTLRVCWSRGLRDAKSVHEFLNPRLEAIQDPFTIRDMGKAVDRLVQAKVSGEFVRIYGDYDVDGTSGAALLSWFLRDCGYKYDARQPDRFKDGYGLGAGAVVEAAEAGVKVLVTIDCGITSFDAALKARELGIDLIVVDHHQLDVKQGMPEAFAVVNPQRADCESGLKQLCGCGLAFYVSRALRARGKELGWWPAGSEPNLKQHLDLVVIATAADMVPLTGDNHALVRHGLEVLRESKKPGVRAMMEAAGLSKAELSPGHLGFVLGPRINASGRMGSASHALELLSTADPSRASKLAFELEAMNKERQETQNRIWDEVRTRIEAALAEGKFQHGIVVADPGWHEGVVGIVASRVTETFRKPAAVIALREDFGKGSVRSFGGKDVLQALRDSAAHLLGFGGHKHAAGLSLALDRVDAFAESFDAALGLLPESRDGGLLWIEGRCGVDELELKTLRELESLGPFGPGNPEPVFAVEAELVSRQTLKGRHLKAQLASVSETRHPSTGRVNTVEAIWFHAAEREDALSALDETLVSIWAGVPELNRFRGRVTPTLRIKDWKPEWR